MSRKRDRGAFGRSVLSAPRKTNNNRSALAAKVEIRENVLAEIGESAAVFDAYGGEGELYDAVWHRAAKYVGCDTTWYRDDRVMYVADNCRVMRAIDLTQFQIVDCDAYGSPWEPLAILCARRPVAPGERIGIVLTEGSGLKIKMGTIPFSLAYMARVDPKIRGASGRDGQAKIIARAINEMARRMNCRIVRRWEAHGKAASNMVYAGMILQGMEVSS